MSPECISIDNMEEFCVSTFSSSSSLFEKLVRGIKENGISQTKDLCCCNQCQKKDWGEKKKEETLFKCQIGKSVKVSNMEIHKCLVWGIPLPFQTLEEMNSLHKSFFGEKKKVIHAENFHSVQL